MAPLFIEESQSNIELFSRSTYLPMEKRNLENVPAGLLLRAWDQRHEIMDALDRLPQVFCQQDAFLRNLFFEPAGSGERPIAVD